MRSTAVLMVAVVLGVLPGMAGAARGDSMSCGGEVTADITLTADLDCGEGTAFRITTSGVRVDLGGYTLSGSGSVGIAIDVSDEPATGRVVIRNGVIEGYETSVRLDMGPRTLLKDLVVDDVWSSNSENGTLRASHVRGQFHVQDDGGWTFRDNVFAGGGLSFGQANRNRVVNNRFIGANIAVEGGHNVVRGNHVYGANQVGGQQVGIYVGDLTEGSLVKNNTVVGADVGIRMAGIIHNSVVLRGNHVTGFSDAGIAIDDSIIADYFTPAAPVRLIGNTVRYDVGTAADAIRVAAGIDHVVLTGNRVGRVSGFEFYAPDSVDGGRNRAPRGPSIECVGIDC